MSDALLTAIVVVVVLVWIAVAAVLTWLTDRGRWNGED